MSSVESVGISIYKCPTKKASKVNFEKCDLKVTEKVTVLKIYGNRGSLYRIKSYEYSPFANNQSDNWIISSVEYHVLIYTWFQFLKKKSADAFLVKPAVDFSQRQCSLASSNDEFMIYPPFNVISEQRQVKYKVPSATSSNWSNRNINGCSQKRLNRVFNSTGRQ